MRKPNIRYVQSMLKVLLAFFLFLAFAPLLVGLVANWRM